MSERSNGGGGFSPRSLARASLARIGGGRAATPGVLDPLLTIVRQSHPKADLSIIERAYDVAEEKHRGQSRKSGDPYITHPLAVTTILAELGMTPVTLAATPSRTPTTASRTSRRISARRWPSSSTGSPSSTR